MKDSQVAADSSPASADRAWSVSSSMKSYSTIEREFDYGPLDVDSQDISPALLVLCSAVSQGDMRSYPGRGVIWIDSNAQISTICQDNDTANCLIPIYASLDFELSIAEAVQTLKHDLQEKTQQHREDPNIRSRAIVRHVLILEASQIVGGSPNWVQRLKALGKTEESLPTTLLHCVLEQNRPSLRICMAYRGVDGHSRMQSAVDNFLHVFTKSLSHPRLRLKDIVGGLLPSSSTDSAPDVPPFWNACVHEVIQAQCQKAPDALAILAWDGSFTYGELDELSDRLASALALLGIGPESFVPICMEKSRWTTVAILGVIKSGGAFSLLDPSHPLPRLRLICDDLQCPFMLASEAQAMRCLELMDALVVEQLSQAWRISPGIREMPLVQPDNALYVAFTSGSTGKPKGAVIEHRAYCSGAQFHLQAFQISRRSHILQFAAYAFDVSIMETLSTLMAGACLCVPSEAQRNDMTLFEDAMKTFRLTHAFLTPSFARMVSWTDIEKRPTLILGGEPMRESDSTMYSALGMRLMNAYGPAECAVNATVQHHVRPGQPVQNIGKPTGAVAWIVDPGDLERPMPWDTVGELLIEGPIIGRGYLNNLDATRSAFIDPPTWLQRLRKGQYQHRVYRTGDLATQSPTGDLRIVGRKDGQLKIRGQRVEIADIENHIHDLVAPNTEVIVEKIITLDHRESLVAFIARDPHLNAQWKDCLLLGPSCSDVENFNDLRSQLGDRLPGYMIPDLWIPLAGLLRTVSGKVDRRGLRDMATEMSQGDLCAFAFSMTEVRAPATSSERALQRAYANILQIQPTAIGMGDTLLRLGGDSLLAIRLIGAARKEGLALKLQDVLGPVTLADQAKHATTIAPSSEAGYSPFSLLDSKAKPEIFRLAQEECCVEKSQIEDIYPCTPLQESMFATSLNHPGMYTGKIVFRIPLDVDLTRFKAAWKTVADHNPILRTRFVQTSHGVVQVVVKDTFVWSEHTDSFEIPEIAIFPALSGQPLIQYIHKKQDRELVLIVHHALWDDWTLRLIRKQVETAYQGRLLEKHPFHPFIQFTRDLPGMENFWSKVLSELDAALFPELPAAKYRPKPTQFLQHSIEGLAANIQSSHTLPVYIYLAWGLLVGHYTESSDVVYGVTLSGRNAPVPDIETLVGPTITTVPLRVQFQPVTTIVTALDEVQRTLVSMVPYEQAGLPRIAKCGQDAARACQFQTQLLIQSADETSHGGLLETIKGTAHAGMSYAAFSEYALMLSFRPSGDRTRMTIDATFDSDAISSDRMHRMMSQFTHILHQIMQQPAQLIEAVEMACPDDLIQLQRWNPEIPPADPRCLHDLFLARCLSQPQATAVCAWNGSATYSDLANLSASLAYQLRSLGVHPGSAVGICLERSMWSVVAILAVLRAGGTCILLDFHHPARRIHDVLQQTSAQVVINSPATTVLTSGLAPVEFCLAPESTDALPQIPDFVDAKVSPNAAAFIMFTSGSTGRPKGIVMPHTTLASSIRHHSAPMNVGVDSRVLHFSSYAFDVSIYEIFTTLAAGATICIPSEFERTNELAQAICRFQVNWAFLTPSTVQTLQPSEVPCLSTLVLGGEALTRDNVETWGPGRMLINGYGPAEATICGVGRIPSTGWTQGVIGSIVGGMGWVTMPTDPSRLAAIGAIGELLLEGPFLAEGYLNLPAITATSFIEPPAWRQRMSLEPSSGLYRTGDLVQYQDDGAIRYIGRKDTRLKLHGQLIELCEVESNTLHEFPAATSVAAEVISLNKSATLVAFIQGTWDRSEKQAAGEILSPVCQQFRRSATEVQRSLQGCLPSYMIPSLFVPVQNMPRTVTGKLDRRSLRSAVGFLSPEELQHYRAEPRVKVPVSSEAERLLQGMWADLLGTAKDQIGAEDNFLVTGGDSVVTMRMVAMARRAGFLFTVTDVLSPSSSLSSLALTWQEEPAQEGPVWAAPAEPSILTSADFQQHLVCLRKQGMLPLKCNVTSALPVTEAQSSLLQRYPWSHFQFPFQGEISQDRLRGACQALLCAHSALRGVFVQFDDKLFQLTLDDNVDLHLEVVITAHQLEPFCESLCHSGQALLPQLAGMSTRFTLVSNPTRTDHRLIIRLSHAQYDANSIPILLRDLEAVYNGHKKTMSSSFDSYREQRAEHAKQKQSQAFWQEYLSGSLAPSSPSNLTSTTQSAPATGTCTLTLSAGLPATTTLPTVVKAATCLVLARTLHQPDIVVGQTVDGRSLPFPDIDRVVGACINYIPFRVRPRASMTAHEYLLHAQAQHTCSLSFESIDLCDIVAQCTDWPRSTGFSYIVQHQTADHGLTLTLDGHQSGPMSSIGRLAPKSEVWVCSTETPSGVKIDIHCSEGSMNHQQATSMAGNVCRMIDDLLARLDRPLEGIEGMKFLC